MTDEEQEDLFKREDWLAYYIQDAVLFRAAKMTRDHWVDDHDRECFRVSRGCLNPEGREWAISNENIRPIVREANIFFMGMFKQLLQPLLDLDWYNYYDLPVAQGPMKIVHKDMKMHIWNHEQKGWAKLEAIGAEMGMFNPDTKTWKI